MEKFILSGHTKFGPKFLLTLPSAKTFENVAVKNVEAEACKKELIMKAVLRRKKIIGEHEKCHVSPSATINYKYHKLPKTLLDILNAHHFPLNQGPVVLPLDTTTESKFSENEVVSRRTLFSHSVDQPCGLWVPKVFGPAAWTSKPEEGTFMVTESNGNIAAAASRMDMSWCSPVSLRAARSSAPAMCAGLQGVYAATTCENFEFCVKPAVPSVPSIK